MLVLVLFTFQTDTVLVDLKAKIGQKYYIRNEMRVKRLKCKEERKIEWLNRDEIKVKKIENLTFLFICWLKVTGVFVRRGASGCL